MKEENSPKKVFLTFDDGPNEPRTSEILNILKEFGVKASFFVCGRNVKRYPNVAKRIVQEGHLIGNHSYSHSGFLTYFGFLRKEIKKTTEIIQEVAGVRTNFIRPPWGITRPWLKRYLEKNGYKVILWNITIHNNLASPSAEIIAQKILKRVSDNSIILLHDGKGIFNNPNSSRIVYALPLIITHLRAQNYTFEILHEEKN